MIDTNKIGERIAKLRKERGMTGEKFAGLLDVSPQAVSKWETGKNLPETMLLPSISKLLGVSIDSILIPKTYPVKLHLGGHYIDGLPLLRWGQSCDCTWAGSVKLLLDAIGVNLTYPEIMGFSGTCYYFSMTSNWCPSAAMPQIEYDPNIILEQAIGVERGSFVSEDRDCKVKEAISRGMPVMLIEPRVEMEWGVLCGYSGDGRFYGRSYFDNLKPDEKDIFTDNNYFLADKYPGADPSLMYFLCGRTVPLPLNEALKASLETARNLYTAKPRHNGHYVFGLTAYDILINGLRCDDADFAAITQYGTTGNGIILLTRLIDARRAAHTFWTEKSQYLSAVNAQKMRDVAEFYANIVSALNAVLPNDFIASTQNGYPFEAWSYETRIRFADALTICKQLEQQVIGIIDDVLMHW
ncbi:helix-turn-helix domain-containing protein [Lacrimispora sp.]|uniref:helix-turn-helix domain-containing protein n=1 Tax=Lacrimispora sp. TaxID=2719234 RepID=UPI00289C525F|nr:helix-turn-helix transcriptional regulator [Lacrimispora sp.]